MGALPSGARIRVSDFILRPVFFDEPQFGGCLRRQFPLDRIQTGMGDIPQQAFEHQLMELHQEFPVVRSEAESRSADETSEAAILVIEDSRLAQGKHKSITEQKGKSRSIAGNRFNAGDYGGSGEQPRLHAAGAEKPSQQ